MWKQKSVNTKFPRYIYLIFVKPIHWQIYFPTNSKNEIYVWFLFACYAYILVIWSGDTLYSHFTFIKTFFNAIESNCVINFQCLVSVLTSFNKCSIYNTISLPLIKGCLTKWIWCNPTFRSWNNRLTSEDLALWSLERWRMRVYVIFSSKGSMAACFQGGVEDFYPYFKCFIVVVTWIRVW